MDRALNLLKCLLALLCQEFEVHWNMRASCRLSCAGVGVAEL